MTGFTRHVTHIGALMSRSINKGINIQIEYLRFFAISFVLFEHIPTLYMWSQHLFFHHLSKYLQFWSGVDLFFAISGFLVGTHLLESLKLKKNEADKFSCIILPFYIKRIYRLLPCSFFWMLAVIILSYFYNETAAFGYFQHNIIYSFTIVSFTFNIFSGYLLEHGFLPTYGPYWSLSLEEQFYMIAPFILLFLRPLLRNIILLSSFALLLFFVKQGDWSPNFRFHGLILGVLLAILKIKAGNKINPTILENKIARRVTTSILLLFLLLAPAFFNGTWYLFGCLAFISVILVYVACWQESYLLRISQDHYLSKIMAWIASRSYSIYLVHMPVIYFIQETTIKIMLFFSIAPIDSNTRYLFMTIITLLLIFFLSDLSYRFLELPMRDKGRSISKKYA